MIPSAPGKRAAVSVGNGLFCGLDGSALTPSVPIELSPARAHVLRCASSQDGKGQVELTLGKEVAGAVTLQTTLGDPNSDAGGATRSLIVKVLDAIGAPVSGVEVRVLAQEGVTASAFVESSASPGTYVASLRTAFGKAVKLELAVAGITQAQTVAAVAIDAPAPVVAGAPVAEPARSWEVGGALGVSNASHRFGPGLAVSIDFAFRRALGAGLITIGLRPGYERYAIGHTQQVSCGSPGDANCGSNILSYTQSLTADVFAIGLPVGFRLFASQPVTPYAVVTPQLLLARTRDRASGAITSSLQRPDPSSADGTSTSFALAGALGVAIRAGAQANLMIEVGYRTARNFALPQGDGRLQGVNASIGVRWAF